MIKLFFAGNGVGKNLHFSRGGGGCSGGFNLGFRYQKDVNLLRRYSHE